MLSFLDASHVLYTSRNVCSVCSAYDYIVVCIHVHGYIRITLHNLHGILLCACTFAMCYVKKRAATKLSWKCCSSSK